MKLRPMRPEEVDDVATVWHETRTETHTAIGVAETLDLAGSRRVFAEHIAPRSQLFVAEEDGALVGFLAMQGETMDRLYVRPGAQRRGVGTALLALAREISPGGITLFTHQRNAAARAFYEKHGFLTVRLGTSPPPESAPDVEYRWQPG